LPVAVGCAAGVQVIVSDVCQFDLSKTRRTSPRAY
jgi:hypothetical protein